jgi:RNA polymerase sigma-70 factor (ECF subfamily)
VKAEDDAEDVRRVLEGDLSAFEAIVRRWQRPLVNLAYRFCRDPGRAEEMAQDVFMKVYRALASYRAGSAFSTWMFAIAANTYRSHMRRHSPPMVSLDGIAEMTAPGSGHDLLEDDDRRDLVRRAVSSLPARYRDALTLFYFMEMDVDAAAGALGLPPGTLKARLHRGRGMLKNKLSGILSPQPQPEGG